MLDAARRLTHEICRKGWVKTGLSQGDIMTGKIRMEELEGDAYTDAITTADKFMLTRCRKTDAD